MFTLPARMAPDTMQSSAACSGLVSQTGPSPVKEGKATNNCNASSSPKLVRRDRECQGPKDASSLEYTVCSGEKRGAVRPSCEFKVCIE